MAEDQLRTRAANDPELVRRMSADRTTARLGIEFVNKTAPFKYSYNFTWLGRPIIQFPQDIVAIQEILWNVRPELVVETGVAHGGGLVLMASILEVIGGPGRVLGIDIEIRRHNRAELEKHPLARRIDLIEGSSVSDETLARVRAAARGKAPVVVVLDSNHTREHVLRELQLYSPLVGLGSYLVAFDTVVEDMREDAFPGKPWGKGNNPRTAVRDFLRTTDRFVVDEEIGQKLLITCAPDGYLRCVKD